MAVRITDVETDTPQSVHQSGMVWLRDRTFLALSQGSKKTDEVLKDGWFRTGDMVAMTQTGFSTSKVVLAASQNWREMVPHETVEDALIRRSGWKTKARRRIAVIGVPDIEKGEALVFAHTLPAAVFSRRC